MVTGVLGHISETHIIRKNSKGRPFWTENWSLHTFTAFGLWKSRDEYKPQQSEKMAIAVAATAVTCTIMA